MPDLKYVLDATRSIAPLTKKGDLIVIESTSPVGTTECGEGTNCERSQPEGVSICYCPERVIPGNILHESVITA